MIKEVRVRFAPSPTGALHIGGVRTALYNYLFAKKSNGKFLLRIEDTDQTRYVPGAEEYILEALAWLGISPDEGQGIGGPDAPYRQSERKPMYKAYAQQLIDAGFAYYAFDTPEELDAMRERLNKAGVPNPQYNAITRATMKNSLVLPQEEVKQRLDAGDAYVIRIKIPRKEEVRVNDIIRGWVLVHSSSLDDKVLMKSDGMPTYHLANVVDDHLMRITHVIRGEEWLPSAPLHVLLYKYLGWEDTMPEFAHLPLLLKPDGNGKLSKRDADMHGFPVFPLQWQPAGAEKTIGFREEGYLPEALLNFLAFLGWNPGTQQEIFSLTELVEAFTLEKIGKAGAKFDINKANWYNQHYLRGMENSALGAILKTDLEKKGINTSLESAQEIASLLKERITFAKEMVAEGEYFFKSPKEYDAVLSQKWSAEASEVSLAFADKLISIATETSAEEIKHILHEIVENQKLKIGKVLQPIRILITGKPAGPDLMQIIKIIGTNEASERLKKGVEFANRV